jgi:hypothetical protein
MWLGSSPWKFHFFSPEMSPLQFEVPFSPTTRSLTRPAAFGQCEQ